MHHSMRSHCIYSTVTAAENACGEIVDGAQWCARPSRESRRVRLRVSSRTGDPTRAARTAVERRRRIERPAVRMTVAKERDVPLLGGGTCTGGPSCAPRRSNTAIIPWKHPVPQFARCYYIYHAVALPRGSSFSSPKMHISSARKT